MVRGGSGKKAFHGSFALHLFNLLRTIRRGKQTVALRVEFEEGKTGVIYFQKGKLVHAEVGERTGEAAFFELIESRDGEYQKLSGVHADVVSIERDAHALIDECKKRMDAEAVRPSEKPQASEDALKVSSGDWSPPPAPARGFQEEFWMQDWGSGTPGFRTARILRRDGTRVMEVRADGESASEEPPALDGLLDGAARLLGAEADSIRLRLQSPEVLCLIAPLAEGYFLVVTLDGRTADAQPVERRFERLVTALNETLKLA